MEDILASIRRILAEDEPAAGAASAEDTGRGGNGSAQVGLKDDVLILDSSMRAPAAPPPAMTPPPEPAPMIERIPGIVAEPVMMATIAEPPVMAVASVAHPDGEMRPLVIRNTLPCFEDVVREALRPVVKQWLDATLPKLAERLVRTEVERVVGGVV